MRGETQICTRDAKVGQCRSCFARETRGETQICTRDAKVGQFRIAKAIFSKIANSISFLRVCNCRRYVHFCCTKYQKIEHRVHGAAKDSAGQARFERKNHTMPKFHRFYNLERCEDTRAFCIKINERKDYVTEFLATLCNVPGGQTQWKQKLVTQTLHLDFWRKMALRHHARPLRRKVSKMQSKHERKLLILIV